MSRRSPTFVSLSLSFCHSAFCILMIPILAILANIKRMSHQAYFIINFVWLREIQLHLHVSTKNQQLCIRAWNTLSQQIVANIFSNLKYSQRIFVAIVVESSRSRPANAAALSSSSGALFSTECIEAKEYESAEGNAFATIATSFVLGQLFVQLARARDMRPQAGSEAKPASGAEAISPGAFASIKENVLFFYHFYLYFTMFVAHSCCS